MLTESFIAATLSANKPNAHLSSTLKDVGVFLYEFQPQNTFRQGFKKSSILPQGLATSDHHIFAAQADKAIINVYNRTKGNQEATIPFPDKIKSVAYADPAAVLVIGTDDGKLILWETVTGHISTSSASHLQPVTHLSLTANNDIVVSGSADTALHIWSLSGLLAFPYAASSQDTLSGLNSPLATFSKHRSPIAALSIGHSASTTNFAVSASADQICYIWHLETCQVLRALLLPAVAICATIDPADRAIYFGGADGTIQHVDLFGNSTRTSKTSIFEADHTPIQLSAADSWKPTTDLGATQSITLTYDGSSLLSGHKGGKIIRWDVAKHRIISEVANLNQPVSHINMLPPLGFMHAPPPFIISTVVKPRLDLGIQSDEGSLGIPLSYSIQAQVTPTNIKPADFDRDVCKAITEPGLPDSLIAEALKALLRDSQDEPKSHTTTKITRNIASEVESNRLSEENAVLKTRVANLLRAQEEQRSRHMKRAKQRQDLMMKKVEAFSTARKMGEDGDLAMKPFEELERSINVASDEEYIGDTSMNIDN